MSLKTFAALAGVTSLLGAQLLAIPAGASAAANRNEHIAFTTLVNNTPSIWTMPPDGKHPRLIVHNGHSPAWPAYGSALAFVRPLGPLDARIYLANSKGANQRLLTNSYGGSESTPAWAQNGRQLAFVRHITRASKQYQAIFTIAANGEHETNITGWNQHHYRSVAWSPSGRHLLYEAYTPGQAGILHIVQLATKHTKTLTQLSDPVDSRASWSPDGQKILYADSETALYTIWADGTHRTVISDGESAQGAWSPDGKQIAFVEAEGSQGISIRQTDDSIVEIPIQQGIRQKIAQLAWSPDSTRLISQLSCPRTAESRVVGIYTVFLEPLRPSLSQLFNGAVQDLQWRYVTTKN